MKKTLLLTIIASFVFYIGRTQEWIDPEFIIPIPYESSEQDRYYDELVFSSSEFPTDEEVLNYTPEYFTISEMTSEYEPYSVERFVENPYFIEEMAIRQEEWARQRKYHNIGMDDPEEWEKIFIPRETIGGIETRCIIKYEKQGEIEAFLYKDYYDFGEGIGVSLAVKKNGSADWVYYFTGMTAQQPFEPKWYSAIPLIVDENTFRIEVAAFKQISPAVLPVGIPEFSLVKDGLMATFDIRTLSRDSDSDGLTDIVEGVYMTDPYNPDTNGNGTPDNTDLNPRFSEGATDLTEVYEYFIHKEFVRPDLENLDATPEVVQDERGFIDLDMSEYNSDVTHNPNEVKTIWIVSDDPAVRAIKPKNVRVIVLTHNDSRIIENTHFATKLEKMHFDPVFKIDDHKDHFFFGYSRTTWSVTYVLKKADGRWKIREYSGFII